MQDQVVETFKRAVNRELDGHTFGELPHRYIVSHFGEIVLPINVIVDSADSFALWESAYNTVKARIAVMGGGDNLAPGVWYSYIRNAFIFDASTSFKDVHEAAQFGFDNFQESVYDSLTGDDFPVSRYF